MIGVFFLFFNVNFRYLNSRKKIIQLFHDPESGQSTTIGGQNQVLSLLFQEFLVPQKALMRRARGRGQNLLSLGRP